MAGGHSHTARTRRRSRELRTKGLTYQQIADELGISYNSARNFAMGYEPKREQRLCPACGDELRRRGKRGWLCPECGAEFSRWAIMTPEERARSQARSQEALRRLRARTQAVVLAAKDVPCTDCGCRYPPPVMHFDHVQGEKLFIISVWSRVSLNVAKVEAEIAKCEVRCANCHIIRHYELEAAACR